MFAAWPWHGLALNGLGTEKGGINKMCDSVSVGSLERGLQDKGRRTEGGQEGVEWVETNVFAYSVMWRGRKRPIGGVRVG